MNKTILTTTAAVLLTMSLSAGLWAGANEAESKAAQQASAISMEQAIAIAKQLSGGGWVEEAEFELEDGVAVYEVELNMADGSEVEIMIDAQSGEVLAQETEEDGEKDDDEKDGANA